MSCDVFSRSNAVNLLCGKKIWLFGSSNIRATYKDLVWLLHNGTMLPHASLKTKNEFSHCNDQRTSQGTLHNGRNYEEVREYTGANNIAIKFTFITRLFANNFVKCIDEATDFPNYIVLNSCVWDLSRWGPDGVKTFKENLASTLKFLSEKLPTTTRVIFCTTLPLSFQCEGGFLTKPVSFLRLTGLQISLTSNSYIYLYCRYMLPWHIMEANKYISEQVHEYKYDVLDLHYHMKYFMEFLTYDGIHWSNAAYRFMTNMILTHIALCEKKRMPAVIALDNNLVRGMEVVIKPSHEDSNLILSRQVKASRDNMKRKRKALRRRALMKNHNIRVNKNVTVFYHNRKKIIIINFNN